MAELTPLDEKLGEVLGLAQAAQEATRTVAKLAEDEAHVEQLDRMRADAEETERRTLALIDGLEGKKTKIREQGRETKAEATEMMKTYLGDDADELDGFEFLTMAEAGELGHWEIVREISGKTGDRRGARSWPSGPCRSSSVTPRSCASARSSWPQKRRSKPDGVPRPAAHGHFVIIAWTPSTTPAANRANATTASTA